MGQECQKCQNIQEGHSNEIYKQEVINSNSGPEYEEHDEKHPCDRNGVILEKPPSMDSKSNSTTFIKEQYNSLEQKQEQIESHQTQLKFQDGGIYTGVIINNMADEFAGLAKKGSFEMGKRIEKEFYKWSQKSIYKWRMDRQYDQIDKCEWSEVRAIYIGLGQKLNVWERILQMDRWEILRWRIRK